MMFRSARSFTSSTLRQVSLFGSMSSRSKPRASSLSSLSLSSWYQRASIPAATRLWAAVMAWMRVNMVGQLESRDGEPHDCYTCHGEPPGIFEGLLDAWAEP